MKEVVGVIWEEEGRTLTLEGEPVLEYTLSLPQIEGGGLGGKWINRYYAQLAKDWRRRWEQEVYWQACLELVSRRQRARPFIPWRGELTGETALLRGGLLSLRLFGSETRGDGRCVRVRWGDVWNVPEGAPKLLHSLFPGERRWRDRLWQALVEQGEARRQGGDCFLDSDWIHKVRAIHPLRNWCLTEEGVEVALPQCVASPAAEGCPVFTLALGKEQFISA